MCSILFLGVYLQQKKNLRINFLEIIANKFSMKVKDEKDLEMLLRRIAFVFKSCFIDKSAWWKSMRVCLTGLVVQIFLSLATCTFHQKGFATLPLDTYNFVFTDSKIYVLTQCKNVFSLSFPNQWNQSNYYGPWNLMFPTVTACIRPIGGGNTVLIFYEYIIIF